MLWAGAALNAHSLCAHPAAPITAADPQCAQLALTALANLAAARGTAAAGPISVPHAKTAFDKLSAALQKKLHKGERPGAAEGLEPKQVGSGD